LCLCLFTVHMLTVLFVYSFVYSFICL
jgi:hypothetical protein